jgi:hypothetical protein
MRVVCLHPSAQHTWPQLSVCLSILCLFWISSHPQLAPVRFCNNHDQEEARSIKEVREKAHSKWWASSFMIFFIHVMCFLQDRGEDLDWAREASSCHCGRYHPTLYQTPEAYWYLPTPQPHEGLCSLLDCPQCWKLAWWILLPLPANTRSSWQGSVARKLRAPRKGPARPWTGTALINSCSSGQRIQKPAQVHEGTQTHLTLEELLKYWQLALVTIWSTFLNKQDWTGTDGEIFMNS